MHYRRWSWTTPRGFREFSVIAVGILLLLAALAHQFVPNWLVPDKYPPPVHLYNYFLVGVFGWAAISFSVLWSQSERRQALLGIAYYASYAAIGVGYHALPGGFRKPYVAVAGFTFLLTNGLGIARRERLRLRRCRAQRHYEQACVFHDKRAFDDAMSEVEQAIGHDPGFALAYAAKAAVWLEKGMLNRSLEQAERALSLDGGCAFAYAVCGGISSARCDYEAALADLSRAIALDPGYSRAYAQRALVYEALGMPARAQSDAARAKELESGNDRADSDAPGCDGR